MRLRPHRKLPKEPRPVRLARDIHVNVLLLANQALEQVEEICRREQLSHSQYVALWTLCLADDPECGIPVSAVADGLLTRASDTTRLLDRLERLGLVERTPNPEDRRGVLVRATEAGRERFARVAPELQKFHRTQWSNLTADEAKQFAALLGKALWGEPPPTGN